MTQNGASGTMGQFFSPRFPRDPSPSHSYSARHEQHRHDFRVVWLFTKAWRDGRSGPVETCSRELGAGFLRILPHDTGEPHRAIGRIIFGSAQNHAGSNHLERICSFHALLHGRALEMGLSLGLSLCPGSRLFCESRGARRVLSPAFSSWCFCHVCSGTNRCD